MQGARAHRTTPGTEAGDRGQLNLWIRGNIASQNGWYKKDKKKGPRNGSVVVPEPPMLVSLGTDYSSSALSRGATDGRFDERCRIDRQLLSEPPIGHEPVRRTS
jgi:hypothetical protein